MASTLEQRFGTGRNNFDLLRLLFAAMVVVEHAVILQGRAGDFWGRSGTSGEIGVDGFFVLSGFLVTRSYLRLHSLPRFAWHRFLRIMPGFWVCLLVCAFVVAPAAALIQGLPATAGFTGTPSAWHFLTADWFLVIQQYDIGGVLNAAPHEPSFNGALWTLTFEAFCYLLVAALGLVGVLSRRRWVVLALAAALIVLTVLQENGVAVPMRDMTLRLTLMFALGALAHLYAERIPMNTWLGVLALALVLYSAAAFPHNYRLLGAVPMAYLVFWLATAGTRFVSLRIDLSYGIYIYHWPVIQLLALTSLRWLPDWSFAPVAIFATLPVAIASWFLVEKPALTRKHSPFPDQVAAWLTRSWRSETVVPVDLPLPRQAADDLLDVRVSAAGRRSPAGSA
ncbi:acyltransferase [Pseudonocardia sp. 73-21]|uniref:acyltransferase family protein n=1 Tax=Pseudonocardia sp. 73-21 TaxID=1895809 RepID=UPI00096421C6|nr:acyltransferase [Pseudonocardia sp. 73-21]OJY51606.1 MAG: hypothetical protein BGP03_17100 [Pseudonocardia sp. 73-21]